MLTVVILTLARAYTDYGSAHYGAGASPRGRAVQLDRHHQGAQLVEVEVVEVVGGGEAVDVVGEIVEGLEAVVEVEVVGGEAVVVVVEVVVVEVIEGLRLARHTNLLGYLLTTKAMGFGTVLGGGGGGGAAAKPSVVAFSKSVG